MTEYTSPASAIQPDEVNWSPVSRLITLWPPVSSTQRTTSKATTSIEKLLGSSEPPDAVVRPHVIVWVTAARVWGAESVGAADGPELAGASVWVVVVGLEVTGAPVDGAELAGASVGVVVVGLEVTGAPVDGAELIGALDGIVEVGASVDGAVAVHWPHVSIHR